MKSIKVVLDRLMYEIFFLLEILAVVAASQVDLYLSQVFLQSGETDISRCPINFYGKEFKIVEVSKINHVGEKPCLYIFCFKVYYILLSVIGTSYERLSVNSQRHC